MYISYVYFSEYALFYTLQVIHCTSHSSFDAIISLFLWVFNTDPASSTIFTMLRMLRESKQYRATEKLPTTCQLFCFDNQPFLKVVEGESLHQEYHLRYLAGHTLKKVTDESTKQVEYSWQISKNHFPTKILLEKVRNWVNEETL